MTPLWEYTRDLHHACEEHVVGAAMATGKPPMEWYLDWVHALEQIHQVVDADMPDLLWRADRLGEDTQSIEVEPLDLQATIDYVQRLLIDSNARAGAAYVLTGAHLMGGEIMRRRLQGYPTKHLEWDDRKAAIEELKKLREADGIADAARDCFHALLKIMDEISEKRLVEPCHV
jgi:hypothetical protein